MCPADQTASSRQCSCTSSGHGASFEGKDLHALGITDVLQMQAPPFPPSRPVAPTRHSDRGVTFSIVRRPARAWTTTSEDAPVVVIARSAAVDAAPAPPDAQVLAYLC